MTAAEDRYLSSQAEEYVERIHLWAHRHNVRVRVEAQAALRASLAVLYGALVEDGDAEAFPSLVNDVIGETTVRFQQVVSTRSTQP